MINRFIYLVLLTLTTNQASLNSELCTEVNERLGECPAYSITCTTPYPFRRKIRKHFRCICDTDCEVNYKCCKDSCYMHDVCKRAVSIPTTPASLDLSAQLNSPVTSSLTSQCKEQYPGQCPSYYKNFVTPIAFRLSWVKPYRCKCDSDCKVRYKCCEDSYFAHGVCKPAIRIPTLTGNLGSSSFEEKISAIYTTVNYQEVNLITAYTSSVDKEYGSRVQNDHFSNSEPYIYIDDEDLINGEVEKSEKVSGVISCCGSGDFSGDDEGGRSSGSGEQPLKNDEEDDRFPFSAQKETSGSGSPISDDEDEGISGSGHNTGNRHEKNSVPNNKGSPTISSDDETEDISSSGDNIDINYEKNVGGEQYAFTPNYERSTIFSSDDEIEGISGSGHSIVDFTEKYSGNGQLQNNEGSAVFSGDDEMDEISGSGHNKIIDIYEDSFGNEYGIVKLTTEPYNTVNTDDDDWEFSESGDFENTGTYEQIYKAFTNYYEETSTFRNDVENQISPENEMDKTSYSLDLNIEEKKHNLISKHRAVTEKLGKNKYSSNDINAENSKPSEPAIETQIYPTDINENTGQPRFLKRQTRYYDSNKLKSNIHRKVKMKKLRRDDF